jgi:hypothetical protein
LIGARYCFRSTGRAFGPRRARKIDGAGLRALCELDSKLGYGLTREVAKAALGRLHETRLPLVAARA